MKGRSLSYKGIVKTAVSREKDQFVGAIDLCVLYRPLYLISWDVQVA